MSTLDTLRKQYEIGSACLASAKIFAGENVEDKELDYSAEFDCLCVLWAAGAQNSPDAPVCGSKK